MVTNVYQKSIQIRNPFVSLHFPLLPNTNTNNIISTHFSSSSSSSSFAHCSAKQPSKTQFTDSFFSLMGSVTKRSEHSEEPSIDTIDVHAAKHLISSGHRYLDVRTEEEYRKGHVDADNSFNIPYMFITPEGRVKNTKFLEQVSSVFSKDDHLVVGCQSGVRSVYATTDLIEAGFKHVSNMGGGYIAWEENGFSVKKPKTEL